MNRAHLASAVSLLAAAALTLTGCSTKSVVWISDDLKYDNGKPYVECEQLENRSGNERHVWVAQSVAEEFDAKWSEQGCPAGEIKADNVPDSDPGSGKKRRESNKVASSTTSATRTANSTPRSAAAPTVRGNRTP